jgi:hypothetical protein
VSEVDEKIRKSYMDLYCLTTTFKQKTLLIFSVYRCLSKVYYVKIVTQPDIDAVNNYWIQVKETGFAE